MVPGPCLLSGMSFPAKGTSKASRQETLLQGKALKELEAVCQLHPEADDGFGPEYISVTLQSGKAFSQ